MIAWWRRWQLRRWERILYARERRLEAFKANPYETWFRLPSSVEDSFKNDVSKARYRVDLLRERPSIPEARLEVER